MACSKECILWMSRKPSAKLNSSLISLSSGAWNIFTTVYAYKKIFGVFVIATNAYMFCSLKGWVLNNGNVAAEYHFKSAVTILRLEHISCSGHVWQTPPIKYLHTYR